jgi:hypothetical protein
VYKRIIGGLREGVAIGGGQPGSSAIEGRLLLDDHHVDVEPTQRGQPDTNNEEDYCDGRIGEVWRRRSSAAGKPWTERFE